MTTNIALEKTKPPNDITIGINDKVRNIVLYSKSIMKEKNLRELKFSAVGGPIGRLLEVVEVLKVLIPNLYQQNKITSVTYQPLDSKNTVLNQKIYPKMEVILSLDEFQTKNEGTQDKLPEEKRKQIEQIMNERREQRKKNERKELRKRRVFRRGFRGRRVFIRGFRGGGRVYRIGLSGRKDFKRGLSERRGFKRGLRGFRGGNKNFRVYNRNTDGNKRGIPRRGAPKWNKE